jgi:hypothetical protein
MRPATTITIAVILVVLVGAFILSLVLGGANS